VIVTVTLSETAVLLADGGKTASLPTLVYGIDDPVDTGVTADGFVVGVDENDFKVLVHTVLVDPVGVEYTKISTSASNTLLSSAPQATLVLEVVDTLSNGFTIGSTLGDRFFPISSSDTDTVDHVSLLGLVTETASFVGTRRAGGSVNYIKLAVLPAPNPEKKTKHIRLLLFVQFCHVFVASHLADAAKNQINSVMGDTATNDQELYSNM